MADTITLYNHTVKLLGAGEVDLTALVVSLISSSGTFTASNTAWADVSANEVSGNGWTAGGEAVTSAAVTTITTNDAKLDGDDISVTATGGNIGPASFAVLRDTANDKLLAWIAFDTAQTAGVGTPFLITWNASGIITWTYT